MPLSPRVKFALAVGGATLLSGAGVWVFLTLRERAKGDAPPLLCPAVVGKTAAPSAGVKRGDFLVVQLQSPDGKFNESTWATVVGKAGPDALVVVLSGEQIDEGVKPIAHDKHGLHLGHRMIVERDCIWEVFKPTKMKGKLYCGPEILELAKDLKDEFLFPVAGGLTVQPGDKAQIIVGVKKVPEVSERLWTRIVNISPSGQVLTARVSDHPELTDDHGLSFGSVVRYNRDCIIGV